MSTKCSLPVKRQNWNVLLCHVHKNILLKIPNEDIAAEFVKGSASRRQVFGSWGNNFIKNNHLNIRFSLSSLSEQTSVFLLVYNRGGLYRLKMENFKIELHPIRMKVWSLSYHLKKELWNLSSPAANLLISLFHYTLLNLVKSIMCNNFFLHADRAFMSKDMVLEFNDSEHFKPIFIFLSCFILKLWLFLCFLVVLKNIKKS